MKTKQNLSKDIRNAAMLLLLISGMTLVSCSHKTCTAYSTPLERLDRFKTSKNSSHGASSIPMPYTAKYKARMPKRYLGTF